MFSPSRQRSCICIFFKTFYTHTKVKYNAVYWGIVLSQRSVHLCVWKRTLAVYWDIVFCLNAAFVYVFGSERCLLGHCVLSQRNVHLCVWKRTLFIGVLCFVSTQRSFMCLETNAVYWGVVFCLDKQRSFEPFMCLDGYNLVSSCETQAEHEALDDHHHNFVLLPRRSSADFGAV